MIRIHIPSAASSNGRQPPEDPERPKFGESLFDVAAMPAISEAALVRHGARILRPSEAVVLNDQAPLRPTVYLRDTLLVPDDMLRTDGLPRLGEALRGLGVQLVEPPPLREVLGKDYEYLADTEAFAELPRPVRIEVAEGAARPVDAWTVLQTLRATAATDESLRPEVSRISLEHLMVGSALDGAGGVLFEGVGNTASHGSPDLGGLFDRPTPGTSGRIPVTVALAEPERPPAPGGRRPVVAVLDSGVADHPWLPIEERGPGAGNAVVLVDPPAQALISQSAVDPKTGAATRLPIVGYWDRPAIGEPLLGELSTHTGHGTFIAGLVRQLAPAAQVYALRVMHPDGFAHEADVLVALAWISALVEKKVQPIDVISLSLGYFHEGDAEQNVTDLLKPQLQALAARGVTIVAAAGNFSTSRPFYPAALAVPPGPATAAPLISVGALNPNGTRARFSNEAPWVTCFASGVAMVSTFPAVRGELSPIARGTRREAFDPDDFTSGFAAWSGTSFAAPTVAASLAARFIGLPADEPAGAEAARRAFKDLHPHSRATGGEPSGTTAAEPSGTTAPEPVDAASAGAAPGTPQPVVVES